MSTGRDRDRYVVTQEWLNVEHLNSAFVQGQIIHTVGEKFRQVLFQAENVGDAGIVCGKDNFIYVLEVVQNYIF